MTLLDVKQDLVSRRGALAAEIASLDAEIAQFQALRGELVAEQLDIEEKLKGLVGKARVDKQERGGAGSSAHGARGIDYMQEFDWNDKLKKQMQAVFGIDAFRLCQQGYVIRSKVMTSLNALAAL